MAEFNPDEARFKVLIAGGSLVGLGLALALERAGIDYELFEKGQFAPQLGASIGLHPHSLRILDQLGVWEDIEREIVPLEDRNHYSETGYCFEESHVIGVINKILRRPIIFMERCRALEILHSHIRDKSKLHAFNGVVDYAETKDGVTVTTQDGQTHHGHILVGADGIHSRVRQLMAEKIRESDPESSIHLVEGFTSEYNCIFGVSRNDLSGPFLRDGMVHNVYYSKYSAVAAAGVHGLVFWFLFVKAGSKTRTPNCPQFNHDDAEALIREYGGSQLGPGYTVGDLWNARVKATMAPLEEGVLNKWSHGRVVLMGDAVHKVTINPGLGGNLAYEGIARLTNGLVPLLKKHPNPSNEQLGEVFDRYFAGQSPRAHTVCNLSGQITRYEAQDTWLYKFAAQYIIPLVGDGTKANAYAGFSNQGPWLDYLPLPAIDADLPQQRAKESSPTGGVTTVSKLGSVVAGAAIAVVIYQNYERVSRLLLGW